MLQDLQTKLEELNNIPNLNRGGCAVAAVAIVLFIQRHILSASPKIRYTCWGSNQYAIENNTPDLLSCLHAFVEYKDFLIDSRGIVSEVNASFRRQQAEEVPFELVIIQASHPNQWVRDFDRKNINTIDNIMGTNLQKKFEALNNSHD